MLLLSYMKPVELILIPIALLLQGLGVNTPILFRFLPDYPRIFHRLWERHKNPISWACRPFFTLIIGYGAILESWVILVIGTIGIGTSWFWFPKWKNTPDWAEEFINREYEVITPANPWDFKRVILPSIGLPLALFSLMAFIWFLSYPWNWLGLLIFVLLSLTKIIWSARLQRTIVAPITWVLVIGYVLGVIVGIFSFFLLR